MKNINYENDLKNSYSYSEFIKTGHSLNEMGLSTDSIYNLAKLENDIKNKNGIEVNSEYVLSLIDNLKDVSNSIFKEKIKYSYEKKYPNSNVLEVGNIEHIESDPKNGISPSTYVELKLEKNENNEYPKTLVFCDNSDIKNNISTIADLNNNLIELYFKILHNEFEFENGNISPNSMKNECQGALHKLDDFYETLKNFSSMDINFTKNNFLDSFFLHNESNFDKISTQIPLNTKNDNSKNKTNISEDYTL